VPFYYRSAVDRLRKEGVVDEDFFAAACRREHASAAFEHGLHHEDIRKITGHKSIKALEIYNVSDALHPDARKRLDREAQRRAMERFEDMAAALRVSTADLHAFVSARAQEQRAAEPSGAPAGFVRAAPAAPPAGTAGGGEGAVRSAMRRATTPVLIPPSGPKAPPASRRSR
jgi:hypothetical protein